jgi:transposase
MRKSEKALEFHRQGYKNADIARMLGVSKSTVRGYMKRAGLPPEPANGGPGREKHRTTEAPDVSVDISQNEMVVSMPKTRIETLEDLIAHCKVDLEVWKVDRFLCNKWEMGFKNGEGEAGAIPLFQVKAWFKRKVVVQEIKKDIIALKRDIVRTVKPKMKLRVPRMGPGKSGNLLEVAINDHHFGKLAWAPETGWADYDTKIAAELFDDAIGTIIRRAHMPLDKIVMVVGNDLLNIDNLEGTTTAGTPQDVDSRYHKVFRNTREVVRMSIDRLRGIAPVHVLAVPGNHDTLSAWHVCDSLDCLYSDDSHVTFDIAPNPRKYIDWGECLIMATHGDRVKRKADSLAHIHRAETQHHGPKRFREVHLGHLHKLEAEEINGVRLRVLPSLCATDAYHSYHGYVGNQRSTEAFVWHREDGLIGTVVYNVPLKYERNA